MPKLSFFPFPWIIAACGVIILCFIFGNLALLGLKRHPAETRMHVVDGDPERGRSAIARYGCGGCHVIAGVRGATGRVGPKLEGISQQSYIGGVLANTPANMIAWLQDPPAAAPRTAMPDLGVTLQDARDMAAFLYSKGNPQRP